MSEHQPFDFENMPLTPEQETVALLKQILAALEAQAPKQIIAPLGLGAQGSSTASGGGITKVINKARGK